MLCFDNIASLASPSIDNLSISAIFELGGLNRPRMLNKKAIRLSVGKGKWKAD